MSIVLQRSLCNEYKKSVCAGEDIEHLIVHLHEQHINAGDALKVLREIYKINLAEAKAQLFGHPVWAKEREFSDYMVEQLFMKNDSEM